MCHIFFFHLFFVHCCARIAFEGDSSGDDADVFDPEMKKDKIKQSKRESSSNESDSDIQEDEDVKEEKEQKQSGDQKPKEPKAKKAGKEKKSRDVFTKARAEKVQNAKEVTPND